jgi:hypothetical protein
VKVNAYVSPHSPYVLRCKALLFVGCFTARALPKHTPNGFRNVTRCGASMVKRKALALGIALAPWAACGFHSPGVCLGSTALSSDRKTAGALSSGLKRRRDGSRDGSGQVTSWSRAVPSLNAAASDGSASAPESGARPRSFSSISDATAHLV